MPSLSVQRNLPSKTRSLSAAKVRCPHCGNFSSGGEVAKEHDREHAEEMSYADRTRKYDKSFRHYYGDGEKGFAKGGKVRRFDKGGEAGQDSLQPHGGEDQEEDDREHQRMTSQLEPTGGKRPPRPLPQAPQKYAKGGRVDGSGKVDGIHTSPDECGHLAAGGVCRHLRPSKRRPAGEDYADGGVRNFAEGGGVGSFAGYLAKRRSARGSMKMKGA